MTLLEWISLGLYIITDIMFACLFLVILERVCSIWRKKTGTEKLALVATGWMFVLYLINIIMVVETKL